MEEGAADAGMGLPMYVDDCLLGSTGSGKPPYPGYYALGINAQVLYVNPYKNLIMVRMGMTNRKYVFIPELFEQLSNFGLF